MALADTARAIGAVTQLLRDRIAAKTLLSVSVGRPEPGTIAGDRLNLFLYEAVFDSSLKNVSLDDGQPPPLWLVLKYLMTAFDSTKESDTIDALGNLGTGIRALQELSFLPLTLPLASAVINPLKDNPEELKITFDEASSELLSKVMQGPDDKYRFSIAFQIRPVMIATAEPASYSLLVGVDYTTAPNQTIIGDDGIKNLVIPSLGPVITDISPASFEVDDTVTIFGTDLHLADLSVFVGPIELPTIMQKPDQLKFAVRRDIATSSAISAGSHPVWVSLALPGGRRRSSNILIGNLLPKLGDPPLVPAITLGPVNLVGTPPMAFTDIDLQGLLLGKDTDDVFLALYKDGQTIKLFDVFANIPPVPPPPPPATELLQTGKRLAMTAADAVPPGDYLAILRVNGQQAKSSPLVRLTP